MIGSLVGVLTHKAPPQLLLEVGGVGYELEAPMSTFYSLPALGERTRLLTHLVVREDAHALYGFATLEERGLFRLLLKVSGIGPRIALGILSGMSGSVFAQAVRAQDTSALTRIPGVGRKTAERLIIEMRDRLDDLGGGVVSAVPTGVQVGGAEAEAYGALLALGYKPHEAARMVKAVADDSLSTEELIRRALQGAGRE